MGTVATPDTRPFSVRLDPEVKRRLRVDAARHGRTMNDHLGCVLDQYLPAAEAPTPA